MPLRTVVYLLWGAWCVYWLIAALGAKRSSPRSAVRPPGLLIVVAFVLLRTFNTNNLAVHSPISQVVGMTLLVLGLALAVWARIYLGRNWGMPMSRKDDPKLVTSGPYRFVRHPIYSGILLAILGSGLATNLFWVIGLVFLAAYFIYSATVEERLMTLSFPNTYPSYKARTKMLIPFVI
jgi:protein-S-isoprenylcysteine O-methyltransferase Ste14